MGTSDSDSPYSGEGRHMSHVGVSSVTAEKKPGNRVGYTLLVYNSIQSKLSFKSILARLGVLLLYTIYFNSDFGERLLNIVMRPA
jgi:hypothetical protein